MIKLLRTQGSWDKLPDGKKTLPKTTYSTVCPQQNEKRPYKGLTCLYPQPDGKTTMPTFVIPTARWEDYPIAYLCYAHSQMGRLPNPMAYLCYAHSQMGRLHNPMAYLCYAHSQMGSMLVEAVG